MPRIYMYSTHYMPPISAISLVYALNKRLNRTNGYLSPSRPEKKNFLMCMISVHTNNVVLKLNNSRHEGKSHLWRGPSGQAAVAWRRCWRLQLSCLVDHRQKRMHDVQTLLKILQAFRQCLAGHTVFAIQPATVSARTRNASGCSWPYSGSR